MKELLLHEVSQAPIAALYPHPAATAGRSQVRSRRLGGKIERLSTGLRRSR